MKEVKENLQEAELYAFHLENDYKKIIKAVHTKKASTMILDCKSEVLKTMYREGFVDGNDYERLQI